MKKPQHFKILTLSALALTLTSMPTMAEEIEFSGNIGFVTEYSFRGIAQSNENPAIQGGFDASHSSGAYAGIWGSNVNFNDGDEAHSEVDLYAGYSGSADKVNYDVGVIYYTYPGADSDLNYNFWEGALSLGYDFDKFSASASINYSPEYFGESGTAIYYAAAVDVPLPANLTLSAHIGRQTIDDNVAFAVPDYTDWSAGLSYSTHGFDLSLQYIDTDLDESECADGCDARVVFGVSRSF